MIGDTLTDHWLFNFWRISWCFISPLILLITVIVSWIYPRKLYTNDQLYPGWTNILGNCISFSTLSGVIIWAAYAIIDTVFIKKKVTQLNFNFNFIPWHFWLFKQGFKDAFYSGFRLEAYEGRKLHIGRIGSQ